MISVHGVCVCVCVCVFRSELHDVLTSPLISPSPLTPFRPRPRTSFPRFFHPHTLSAPVRPYNPATLAFSSVYTEAGVPDSRLPPAPPPPRRCPRGIVSADHEHLLSAFGIELPEPIVSRRTPRLPHRPLVLASRHTRTGPRVRTATNETILCVVLVCSTQCVRDVGVLRYP